MNYTEAMEFLERQGFSWAHFREMFPFGEISLGEGNYQRLVTKAVETCNTDAERALLLDLLDAQACVFLEQGWAFQEQLKNLGIQPPGDFGAHIASNWLQVDSNIRGQIDLPRKDGRGAMLKLPCTERCSTEC
jgi:hypothetical protein